MLAPFLNTFVSYPYVVMGLKLLCLVFYLSFFDEAVSFERRFS